MVIGITDASFAGDADVSASGQKLALRSQSGRSICLAHRDFKTGHAGHLLLQEWHRNTIKRLWFISAQDDVDVGWYTDCRSLEEYFNQGGIHIVTDKRLAIDLCILRQMC